MLRTDDSNLWVVDSTQTDDFISSPAANAN